MRRVECKKRIILAAMVYWTNIGGRDRSRRVSFEVTKLGHNFSKMRAAPLFPTSIALTTFAFFPAGSVSASLASLLAF